MENPIKIKLIALAKSILEKRDALDLTEIREKAQKLYEDAVIAHHLQEFEKEIPASENKNMEGEVIEKRIEDSTEENTTSTEPAKEYLEDLLSDVSSEVVFEDKREAIRKQSLNDNFSRTIKIGLNDRIAFIKHLFDGDDVEFLNAVKHIDEALSEKEVIDFIQNEVKPKYNNWKGKEIYQSRFMHWVINRFK